MQLIIGAGTRQKPGWKHHDALELPGIDYVCEFYELPKFVEPESCTAIEMTHMLEHFPTNETQKVLAQIKSFLAPQGTLYLEVPNFSWHASLVLNEFRDEEAVYYAFGGQLDQWDFHKTGFTPSILYKALIAAGFVDIKIIDNSSITATCRKLL